MRSTSENTLGNDLELFVSRPSERSLLALSIYSALLYPIVSYDVVHYLERRGFRISQVMRLLHSQRRTVEVSCEGHYSCEYRLSLPFAHPGPGTCTSPRYIQVPPALLKVGKFILK